MRKLSIHICSALFFVVAVSMSHITGSVIYAQEPGQEDMLEEEYISPEEQASDYEEEVYDDAVDEFAEEGDEDITPPEEQYSDSFEEIYEENTRDEEDQSLKSDEEDGFHETDENRNEHDNQASNEESVPVGEGDEYEDEWIRKDDEEFGEYEQSGSEEKVDSY